MKNLAALLLISFLAGCASTPFTFEGNNAQKGFVVLSTGIAEQCLDELDNTNLLVRRVDDDEIAQTLTMKNIFLTPDVEKNNIQVHSFPLEAGEYVVRDFITPTPLFAAIPRYHDINKFSFTVKPGEIQYQGYFFFEPKQGKCDLDNVAVNRKADKQRDMKVASSQNPQLF